DNRTRLDAKSRRVWDIVNNGGAGRDLQNGDLSFALLNGTDLHGARLVDADLSGADLTGANLLGANLTGANLRFVVLHKSRINDSTVLDGKSRLVWEI